MYFTAKTVFERPILTRDVPGYACKIRLCFISAKMDRKNDGQKKFFGSVLSFVDYVHDIAEIHFLTFPACL